MCILCLLVYVVTLVGALAAVAEISRHLPPPVADILPPSSIPPPPPTSSKQWRHRSRCRCPSPLSLPLRLPTRFAPLGAARAPAARRARAQARTRARGRARRHGRLGTKRAAGTLALRRVSRVSTEVTFGRGDLSVCPIGVFIGPMHLLFLIGGVPPRGPNRDKHYGPFSLGALLCLNESARAPTDTPLSAQGFLAAHLVSFALQHVVQGPEPSLCLVLFCIALSGVGLCCSGVL